MNFNILQGFRHELYGCFEQSRNALFNLADALLRETQAHSVIELSLSPFFETKWPSLYAALPLGKLNQARLEQPPARGGQSRGKGTGRSFWAKIEPAMRYKVVKKTP